VVKVKLCVTDDRRDSGPREDMGQGQGQGQEQEQGQGQEGL